VEFDVNSSDFRELEFLLLVIEGESTLRVGEGVIAVFTFKAGITGFFTLFNAPKEVLEGLI